MEEKQLEDFLPDKNKSYLKKFNNSKIQDREFECKRLAGHLEASWGAILGIFGGLGADLCKNG